MRVCVCMSLCVHVHVSLCMCVHMCVLACVCACMRVRVRACTRVRACVCVCACTRARAPLAELLTMCTVSEATRRNCHRGSRLQTPSFPCVTLLFGFPRARAKGCVFGVPSTTWLLATKYLIVSIPARVGQHSFTDAVLQQIIKSQQRNRTALQTITGMLEHGSFHCSITGRKVTWGPLN